MRRPLDPAQRLQRVEGQRDVRGLGQRQLRPPQGAGEGARHSQPVGRSHERSRRPRHIGRNVSITAVPAEVRSFQSQALFYRYLSNIRKALSTGEPINIAQLDRVSGIAVGHNKH